MVPIIPLVIQVPGLRPRGVGIASRSTEWGGLEQMNFSSSRCSLAYDFLSAGCHHASLPLPSCLQFIYVLAARVREPGLKSALLLQSHSFTCSNFS